MTKKKRRRFTTKEKADILRRHLADKVPVSDLCDEYGIQPSVFYTWQRQALASMEIAFETNGRGKKAKSREAMLEDKIEALESKLTRKDEVIAEISEEYVDLKKKLGGS